MGQIYQHCRYGVFDSLLGEWKCLRLQLKPTDDICRACHKKIKFVSPKKKIKTKRK